MNNYFSQSCNALTTGYDRSGMKNYAYSASIPEFSLTGSQPFTVLATLCMRSVQRGMIFRQEGVFEMGFENGLLYIEAPGICTVKFPKEVMSFIPNFWYAFAVTFDGNKLAVYVDGLLAAETDCSATAAASSGACYEMGADLEAYIRQVLLYPLALTPEEVHSGFLNAPVRTGECAAWFDFCGECVAERSGKGAPVSVKGFAKVVNVCRVLSAEGGMALYAPFDVVHPEEKGYTWTAKIYPHRTNNGTMCIGTNSDAERASGWMLWLQKESDDAFRVCLRTGGAEGAVLTADKTVSTYCWTDVAWTYDGTKITLYLDGEVAGTATGIAAGTLQGDGRTTFCGLTRRGKTDTGYAYSGYVAYVAELGKCVAAEVLAKYTTNRPYVLDEGIAGVFDFTDINLTEKCTLQAFSVNGQAGIAWAENTNLLTDPQQFAFYMPGEDDPYWESLSDELKWEVELYGLIVNSYLCDVLGYELDAANEKWYCPAAAYIVENGLKTPEFREIVKEGPLIQPKTINAFGAGITSGGTLSALGGFIGKICKGGAKIGLGLAESRIILRLIAAAIAAEAVIVAVKVIEKIIEKNKKRPNSEKVRILSIEFNHNSNPATGGIHIRRDNMTAIAPPEWREGVNSEANPARCAYIRGVAAPSIRVTVLLESDDPDMVVIARLNTVESVPHILGNFVSGEFPLTVNIPVDVDIALVGNQLNAGPAMAEPPVNTWWSWHCQLGNEDVFVCNTYHQVYRLVGLPVNPWVFQMGPYNPGQLSYPWTTAMDVAARMCATGVANGGVGLLECLTKGLNETWNFTYAYEGGNHFLHFLNLKDVVFVLFDIVLFQQEFYDLRFIWQINCSDCAIIIGTYGNLHGENMKILLISGNNGGIPGFLCKPIISIGNAEWAEPFGGAGFSYHRIAAHRLNERHVADACLKIDAGPNPSQINLADKIPTVACDMNFSNHPLINWVHIDEPFMDQIYRERLVRNDENCFVMETTENWYLGNVNHAPAQAEGEMSEYYKRIGEYYGITPGLTTSSETPLINASVLRLDAIPDLTGNNGEGYADRTVEQSIYKGKWIHIYIRVCDSIDSAKTDLVYRLGGINYRNIPTAEEMGIKLGEKAFIIQDKDGLNTCILLYRRNVVIHLLCATTEHVDLLPLAYVLDKQMQEG